MMERRSHIRNSIIIIWVVACLMQMLLPTTSSAIDDDVDDESTQLRLNFYEESCPQAEDIISRAVIAAFRKDPASPAGLIRLAFHDCFINGCDGSVMLDKTPSGEKTERNSPVNGPHMRGLNVIDQAKEKLEEECPGIVSCADVIQFAARDSVAMAGLYHYDIPGGRRDGVVSLEKDVEGNLPHPGWSVQQMIDLFERKGLNEEDLVVLLGSHSVGSAYCPTFYYRQQKNDPKLSPKMSQKIKDACGKPNFQDMLNTSLPFDPVSPNRLDPVFYNQLISGEGLIESDQVLTFDPRTAKIVSNMASTEGRWRDEKFVNAMIKMGKIDVKTGTQGEIRRHSRYVNEPDRNEHSGSESESDTANSNDDVIPEINMGPFGNLFSGFFGGIHP